MVCGRSFCLGATCFLAISLYSAFSFLEAGESGEESSGEDRGRAFVEVFGAGIDLDDSGVFREVESGRKRDPVSDLVCRRFSPSVDELRSFFLNSRVIEGQAYSSDYPAYGCWHEGVLRISSREFQWRVTPAGIGYLADSKGVITYLACGLDCLEIFPDS